MVVAVEAGLWRRLCEDFKVQVWSPMEVESMTKGMVNTLEWQVLRQGPFCQGVVGPKCYNLRWNFLPGEADEDAIRSLSFKAIKKFGPQEGPRAKGEAFSTGPVVKALSPYTEETTTLLSPKETTSTELSEFEFVRTPTSEKRHRGKPKKLKREIGKGNTKEGSEISAKKRGRKPKASSRRDDLPAKGDVEIGRRV